MSLFVKQMLSDRRWHDTVMASGSCCGICIVYTRPQKVPLCVLSLADRDRF